MFLADFHIHSKYSRATSKECNPETLDLWAGRKGLDLVGSGDFTHAAWREELREKLLPAEDGLYTLNPSYRIADQSFGGAPARFIISGEISSIYKANGRVRKVHNLILLPGLSTADALSRRLELWGANLHSDGRPILGLSSRDLLEITLDVCPQAVFIPAHIWTPHFSLFGAFSGFDTIEECFGDLTPHIHALETGLSSDPPMNWRLSALDRYTLVSNSDAHSPGNLAREANLFDCELSYPAIQKALDKKNPGFYGTIEFFPEEGKYHFDGHRACNVCLAPSETQAYGGICPECGRRITVGVLSRVEELADRQEGYTPASAPHFENLVPLHQVIAASIGASAASKKVAEQYNELLRCLGNELFILRNAPLQEIERYGGTCVAEGIRRVRAGKVERIPGYDGEYGKIKILDKSEIDRLMGQIQFSGIEAAQGQFPAAQTNRQSISEPARTAKTIVPEAANNFYGLNSEQWEAASARSRVVAVLAGPGTGKTKTLVSRIAYLIDEYGVPPEQITAVTFTNKAAGEMRARLEKHFGDKKFVRSMTIGTFHSICISLLFKQDERLTLIDEFHAQSILNDILAGLNRTDSPRDHLLRISRIKNRAQLPDAADAIFEGYSAHLSEQGLLDFDDILLRVLEHLEKIPEQNPGTSAHLLVDEFQDINEVQYRLILEWGKRSQGIFVIGDPNQSIYGFRGSNSSCFQKLGENFPDIQTVRLSQNYRSTPEILGCALPVLSRSAPAETLHANKENGGRVRIVAAEDSYSEALYVAGEIRRLIGGTDMLSAHRPDTAAAQVSCASGLSDIAVLFRTRRQADNLEQCLQREGIPFVVYGRDDFLGDKQVQGALSFFRYLLNPQETYLLSACMQAIGINAAHREIIQKCCLAKGTSASVAEALLANPVSAYDLSNAEHFLFLLEKFRPMVRKEKPASLLEYWIGENNLAGYAPLEFLLNSALKHVSMPVFIHNVLLGAEADVTRCGNKKYTAEAVSLMTLHGSKGLEFPVVFLLGASDGLIPLKTVHGNNDENEERRLLYVGMTRAQDQLILLTSFSPSPFLAGIPASLSVNESAFARKPAQGRQLSLFG